MRVRDLPSLRVSSVQNEEEIFSSSFLEAPTVGLCINFSLSPFSRRNSAHIRTFLYILVTFQRHEVDLWREKTIPYTMESIFAVGHFIVTYAIEALSFK